jgi:hypothetical protein
VFDGVLDRAAIDGDMPPTGSGLHPAVVKAIEDIARASPNISADMVVRAHNAFALHEGRSRIDAVNDQRHTSATNLRQHTGQVGDGGDEAVG